MRTINQLLDEAQKVREAVGVAMRDEKTVASELAALSETLDSLFEEAARVLASSPRDPHVDIHEPFKPGQQRYALYALEWDGVKRKVRQEIARREGFEAENEAEFISAGTA